MTPPRKTPESRPDKDIFEIEGFRKEVESYLVDVDGTVLATTYRYVKTD